MRIIIGVVEDFEIEWPPFLYLFGVEVEMLKQNEKKQNKRKTKQEKSKTREK